MYVVHTYRSSDQHAKCDTCGWESWAKNSQANGKRHAVRYGHTVFVENNVGLIYSPHASGPDNKIDYNSPAIKTQDQLKMEI